jgi:hypothetical protein
VISWSLDRQHKDMIGSSPFKIVTLGRGSDGPDYVPVCAIVRSNLHRTRVIGRPDSRDTASAAHLTKEPLWN